MAIWFLALLYGAGSVVTLTLVLVMYIISGKRDELDGLTIIYSIVIWPVMLVVLIASFAATWITRRTP